MISLVGFYQSAGCHRGVLCTASSEEAHTGLHCVRGTGVLFCMCLYHVLYVLVARLHGPLVPLCLQCNPNPMPLLATFPDKLHSFMAQDTDQRSMLLPPSLSPSPDAQDHLTFLQIWHLLLRNTNIAFSEHSDHRYSLQDLDPDVIWPTKWHLEKNSAGVAGEIILHQWSTHDGWWSRGWACPHLISKHSISWGYIVFLLCLLVGVCVWWMVSGFGSSGK